MKALVQDVTEAHLAYSQEQCRHLLGVLPGPVGTPCSVRSPDRLDLMRAPAGHFSFGRGPRVQLTAGAMATAMAW